MAPAQVDHALVLNLHQPAGNLDELLATQEWQAKEILGRTPGGPHR